MTPLNVLVACEESQVVTEAFIKKGHNAISCDLNFPGAKGLPHYQGDVRDLLTVRYDLVIFHPVCKFLTNSGVRWLYSDKSRWDNLYAGCDFFNLRDKFNCNHIATENPIPHGYAKLEIGMYDQLFQPWHFGHKQMKATCLWLKNLPPLQWTDIVGPPPKDKKERYLWQDIWRMPPGPEREKLRSRTFQGVADAMADQWSKYLLNINV